MQQILHRALHAQHWFGDLLWHELDGDMKPEMIAWSSGMHVFCLVLQPIYKTSRPSKGGHLAEYLGHLAIVLHPMFCSKKCSCSPGVGRRGKDVLASHGNYP
jgi:hypothetical protein